ncbi:hypothetical protein GUJ93_ZPchr0006g42287 [Zizania palustris]|uniref:Uncharacterized protein n=1 Tax=Zizania palustris TaxID=103762 RepID=A0A8J5T3T6_ZIZPA|nr:hypothetical protein GUJ93_ZPchr0006g42287 [Zizania palustris]
MEEATFYGDGFTPGGKIFPVPPFYCDGFTPSGGILPVEDEELMFNDPCIPAPGSVEGHNQCLSGGDQWMLNGSGVQEFPFLMDFDMLTWPIQCVVDSLGMNQTPVGSLRMNQTPVGSLRMYQTPIDYSLRMNKMHVDYSLRMNQTPIGSFWMNQTPPLPTAADVPVSQVQDMLANEGEEMTEIFRMASECGDDEASSLVWSPDEDKVLLDGLSRLANRDVVNMCLEIAFGLPKKTTLDVAKRARTRVELLAKQEWDQKNLQEERLQSMEDAAFSEPFYSDGFTPGGRILPVPPFCCDGFMPSGGILPAGDEELMFNDPCIPAPGSVEGHNQCFPGGDQWILNDSGVQEFPFPMDFNMLTWPIQCAVDSLGMNQTPVGSLRMNQTPVDSLGINQTPVDSLRMNQTPVDYSLRMNQTPVVSLRMNQTPVGSLRMNQMVIDSAGSNQVQESSFSKPPVLGYPQPLPTAADVPVPRA